MKCETCKMNRVCDEMERMGKVPKHEKCRCYTPTKPITNADRIRAMTDEELAEFISGKARTFGEEYEGYMSALDWLKQEADHV